MTLLDHPLHSTELPQIAGRTLRVAYTPDSDDAFNFYAWEHSHVTLYEWEASFEREHIVHLNRAALAGKHDVTNISSAIYPALADQYYILATGSSVGRHYGPVLVSRRFKSVSELRGRRIAVGGMTTTGAALAAMYCPGAGLIECRYDEIAAAILREEFDAGVMIHEELLFFPQAGLSRVVDLGATWCRETGLPLPVGLNIAHRRLGRKLVGEISCTCRNSLNWAHANFDEAFAYASGFGRGCTKEFVRMFCNDDTLCMPRDVRAALPILFQRVAEMGLVPALKQIEVIDA